MPSLRQAMERHLEDWEDDIATGWRDLLGNTAPAFQDIDGSLRTEPDEVIFPGRKGREPKGAPGGSHTFRAFDGIAPKDVRVVIIGQDPYPDVKRATGRAFEQGDLESWLSKKPNVALSLKRIAQQAAHFRSGKSAYKSTAGGWDHVKKDLASGSLELEAPRDLFNAWQSQGVLMLNAGLTLTRYQPGGHPHQRNGHIPLWAPVVGAICRRIAQRQSVPVVFLCWGSYARRFLARVGVLASAKRPLKIADGMAATDALARNHPATADFLKGPNLFKEANQRLQRLGAAPIDW